MINKHYNRYKDTIHTIEADHAPGTPIKAYLVIYPESETSNQIKYAMDDEEEAVGRSKMGEGWYGATGSVDEVELVRTVDGRWGVWFEVRDVSSHTEQIRRSALAKLTPAERAALGLLPER